MKYFYEIPQGNGSDAEMLDKMRVRELVETDRYCRDYGHFEQEAACWFEDGEVFATWFKGPVKEFLEKSARKDKGPSSHKIFNIPVWMKGNRAIAECLCQIQFRFELQGEPVDLSVNSRLHFRAEKRDGRWGLVYFEGIYEQDRMDPIFMDSTFSIPREEIMQFRSCNWNQCYRLAKANADPFGGGLKNADIWAGPDKPETIERLYAESSRWIFGEE